MGPNKEILGRLVSALRSGKYEQGFGHLNAGGKFCCLGVLCDILKDEIPLNVGFTRSVAPEEDREWEGELITYNGEGELLPLAVSELVGISEAGELPEEWGNCFIFSLYEMNDDGETFGAIADIIERAWLT